MKTIPLLAILIFLSCNDAKKQASDQKDSARISNSASDSMMKPQEEISNQLKSDSVIKPKDGFVEVDDYPVTDLLLRSFIKNRSDLQLRIDQTYSTRKVWFINNALKQSMIFELYTDYYRGAIYHFYSNDVPKDVIREVTLINADGELADENQKQRDFKRFYKRSRKIDSSYFVSKKGFRLGDGKQKAIDEYGKAHKQAIVDEFEKLEWKFEGDDSEDIRTKKKPLAKNSYGYRVLMYFRNDKLIAQIIYNSIP